MSLDPIYFTVAFVYSIFTARKPSSTFVFTFSQLVRKFHLHAHVPSFVSLFIKKFDAIAFQGISVRRAASNSYISPLERR